MKDLDLIWLVVVGVLGWLLWGHFHKRQNLPPPPPPSPNCGFGWWTPCIPPPPRAGAGGSSGVSLPGIEEIGGDTAYYACRSQGGSDEVCKLAKLGGEKLVEGTEYVGAKVEEGAEYVGGKVEDFVNWL